MERLAFYFYSWKILFIDIFKIFELNSENGGSIIEQFEYLKQRFHLSAITKMEKFKLSISHSYLAQNDYDDDSLTVPNTEITASTDPMKALNQALIYFTSVPTHKRASIDSFPV